MNLDFITLCLSTHLCSSTYSGDISLGAFWVLGVHQSGRHGADSLAEFHVPRTWSSPKPLEMCRFVRLPVARKEVPHLFPEAASEAQRKHHSQRAGGLSLIYALCPQPLSYRERVCVEGWEAQGMCSLSTPSQGFLCWVAWGVAHPFVYMITLVFEPQLTIHGAKQG